MAIRNSLKFQYWILGTIVLTVLVLSGTFLWLVQGQLAEQAQEGAEQEFGSLAQSVVAEISELLNVNLNYVNAFANSSTVFAASGEFDIETLTSIFRSTERVTALVAALPNDTSVMIEAAGSGLIARPSMAIPTGADYAITYNWRGADGRLQSEQTFHSASGGELTRYKREASYRASTRPWFQRSVATRATNISDAFRFANGVDSGLMIATPVRGLKGDAGVLATALSLRAFDEALTKPRLSPNAAAFIIDTEQNLLALRVNGRGYGSASALSKLLKLKDAGSERLSRVATLVSSLGANSQSRIELGGRPFILASHAVEPVPGMVYRVVVLAPLSDFTGTLERDQRNVLLIAGVMLLILGPIVWLSTRRVSASLEAMANHAKRLQQLDFSTPPEHVSSFVQEVQALGHAQEVMHASIAQRASELEEARKKLAQLVEVGIQLGRERDREALLHDVLSTTREISNCTMVGLRLRDENNVLKSVLAIGEIAGVGTDDQAMYDSETGQAQTQSILAATALTGKTQVVDDASTDPRTELGMMRKINAKLDRPVRSILSVPLKSAGDRVMGVLHLLNARHPKTGEVVPFSTETIRLVEALAAQAAVAIDNQNLALSQRSLMDSIIQILASAIDAKSAYTGGHCERVPELAFMLAEEAENVDEGPLADFRFQNEEEWREFRIGAWLHDCGKVTTPEYVVDKATKLETIYNRLHEIRTRFEVLLRDARIAAHEAIEAGEDRAAVHAARDLRERQLQEDFAFIAECNIGGEFMAPERIARLEAIALQTWMRHFDDRIGLSQEESKRHHGMPALPLPAVEQLLADKSQHIIPRGPDKALSASKGFEMAIPEHLYNHGELHNLRIGRGTLNAEERFKINEHIIQTIVMLESMPFPDNLKRVPEYAGTHHETMIGTGYPRKLSASELSIPARIMAIADIFEALTASDRPYKKAKSLSESVQILHTFKTNRHIDPTLFDLFLSSGVYRRYAERFLSPEQIDQVDIAPYLG